MTFFAQPNLDNIQFKQLSGSTLTLSGETQIANISGLTLTNGAGGYVPIVATGGTEFDVLTYRGGKIILEPSTTSGGSGVYIGASPTTCTVGGLTTNSNISGCTISCILESILVPTLNPTLTNPTLSSFLVTPTTTIHEVGSSINPQGYTAFNAGCINPQYTSACDKRSNGASGYSYNNFGVTCCVLTTLPTYTYCFGSHTITAGNNVVAARVSYCCGVQPKDSADNNYSSPLSAGVTNICSKTYCGVYPWYWGIESSGGVAAGVNRPTACCIKDAINGGGTNKCVDLSTGTLLVNFNSSSDDYIWFAVPDSSAVKNKWYVDALNNGVIGGSVSAGGNLFPVYDTVNNIESVSPVWNNQTYKIYVSNYQTASSSIMEIRNS